MTRALLGGLACLALAVLAAPASARPTVDLLKDANIRLDGAADSSFPHGQAGWAVASAGDVNGDGRADVIVGAPGSDNNGRVTSGSAYVLYGRASTATRAIDLNALATADGYRIDGATAGEDVGYSVAGAGDVNGDHRDDVVVSAYLANNNSRHGSGSAYVLYGRASPRTGPVDLADTNGGGAGNGTGVDPADGFRIDGASADEQMGSSVAGAGDVDNDGRADLILGAFMAGNNSRANSGSAYVLYGRASPPTGPVDLADTNGGGAGNGTGVDPADGFRIDGAAGGDSTAQSVASAGDVNGDHHADVILGSEEADYNGRANSGSAYVLYGRASAPTGPVDLADTNGGGAGNGTGVDPAHGYRIDGATTGDLTGTSARAGDLNKDGLDDVIVGAWQASYNSRVLSGSAYVLYGRATPPTGPVDLNGLTAAEGFRIDGAVHGDETGFSVAPGGDVDGDGRDDVVLGAPGAGNDGRAGSGSAYVVLGRAPAPTGPVDLAAITAAHGFRIDGAAADDQLGRQVAGAGEINGGVGGGADLIFGSRFADPFGRMDAGAAYLVLGGKDTDNDGKVDQIDNCDNVVNPSQANRDHDALGDACDPDIDGDGVLNGADAFPTDPTRSRLPAVAHPGSTTAPTPTACPAGTSAGVACEALTSGGLRITGTKGKDRIVGSSHSDVVRCGAGSDVVKTGSGNDRVDCAGGRDRVSAGAGNDRVNGGSGNDSISGNAGNDRLSGASGNDKLTGGSGTDRISGGSGKDSISARDRRRERVSCGPGKDRVTADRKDRLRGCERVRRR